MKTIIFFLLICFDRGFSEASASVLVCVCECVFKAFSVHSDAATSGVCMGNLILVQTSWAILKKKCLGLPENNNKIVLLFSVNR